MDNKLIEKKLLALSDCNSRSNITLSNVELEMGDLLGDLKEFRNKEKTEGIVDRRDNLIFSAIDKRDDLRKFIKEKNLPIDIDLNLRVIVDIVAIRK